MARHARTVETYADRSIEAGIPSHELWAQKFVFRREMLPSFLEESFGRKVSSRVSVTCAYPVGVLTSHRAQIFSTGKSLNFMKYSCDDDSWVTLRSGVNAPGAFRLLPRVARLWP